jgi:GDPmannose 4,6-dehydratase
VANKVALITGVTGQDGSYLAELLLDKGYEVHAVARRTSALARDRIDGLRERVRKTRQVFEIHYGDLGDSSSLNRIVALTRPDELYNLAAQSHVAVSFQQPEYTSDIVGTGVLRLLEAIRIARLPTRFYQASTSELYGKVEQTPQNEETPFHPRSPYGVAKLYAFWIVKNYREAYDMHASNGILFNHESPRRGENFVTRKITIGLARLKAGSDRPVELGNLDARRDWGFAGEYVEAMWRMLQLDRPEDFVIATGETHTVREFVNGAAAVAGFDVVWEGTGQNEVGRDRRTGKVLVEVDPAYYRPAEVDLLLGDPAKAKRLLGWQPQVKFEQLVEMMMRADLQACGAA